MNNNKDFLFYSNLCPHSNKLMEILKKNNLIDNYELCCVDNTEIELPDFINSVPTLYIVDQKRVLVDEGLFHYMNIEINKKSNTLTQPIQQQPQQIQQSQQLQQPQQSQQTTSSSMGQMENQTGDPSITGFHSTEMGASFSDNYSFIDNNKHIEHSYSFIGDNNVSNEAQTLPSNTTMANEQQNTNKSSLMDKAYEDMMKQRGADMPQGISGMRI